jgi:hypothetical protein
MRACRTLARVVGARWQGDAEGKSRLRIEPEIHVAESLHAAHHQARGDKQHERQCDLRRHEHVAGAMLTAGRGLTAATVVQSRGDRREAQERDRAKGKGREQAQPGGKGDHNRIDTHFGEARQIDGTECDQQPDAGPGEPEAKDAADYSEQYALREEVARQPSRPRAERATNRHFAVTRFGAHEEQVGDVRACHEQYEADGREQDPERAGDVADDVIVERQRRGHDARLIRGPASQILDQSCDLGACTRDDRVVAQPGDALDREQERRRRARRLCRLPQIDLRSRKCERGRHDAHDVRRDAIDQYGPADDGGFAAEPPKPEAMCQHGNRRRTRDALRLGEPSAECGRHAQYRQQRRCPARDHEALRRAAARQRAAAPGVSGDAIERTGVVRELVVQLPGHDLHARRNISARDAVVEEQQPFRVGVRQRVEDHAINEGEDRSVSRDRERQRRRGSRSEDGCAHQPSHRVTQFLRNHVHCDVPIRRIGRRAIWKGWCLASQSVTSLRLEASTPAHTPPSR